MRWKVALLSASDKGARGEREDTSAQVIRELVEEELGGEIVDYRVVPDEQDEIRAALIEMADYYQSDLIITTGGVGLGLRDVTPEATLLVSDRLVPGLSEAMRTAAVARSRAHALCRGICAIRRRSLILNLPGDPKGVFDHLHPILDLLPEALMQVSGMRKESRA
jgi:molybdenum cofactor synthesis domain-containing protein